MKRFPLLRSYLRVESGLQAKELEKCKLAARENETQNDVFKSLICPNATTIASIACRSNLHSTEHNIPTMTLSSLIIISFI